ncbi:MAG: 23S rRNA (adenine(2503)-C(2))-methyltransferase RlmN [Bacteroidota bacterium]
MGKSQKQDIRGLSRSALEKLITGIGEKKYRAGQVYEWIWNHNADSFDDMKNIPLKLREYLDREYIINRLRIEKEQISHDGTVKTAFLTADGGITESVAIPSAQRLTVCISSHTGCVLGCKFCASAGVTDAKKLTCGEITDQFTAGIIYSSRKSLAVTNLVFMGMGEPLLNYENITGAIEKINEIHNFSPQRMTVSTAGIPDKIRHLAAFPLKINLALSLHSAIDSKRNNIMPVNKKYPLNKISEALVYYHSITGKRITIEYLLLKEFNDGKDDAEALISFLRPFPVKINIIEYNRVDGSPYFPSEKKVAEQFIAMLERQNFIINIRKSRGKDINAACGQLAGRLSASYHK